MKEAGFTHAEIEALIAEYWPGDQRLPFQSFKDVYRVAAHRFFRLAEDREARRLMMLEESGGFKVPRYEEV